MSCSTSLREASTQSVPSPLLWIAVLGAVLVASLGTLVAELPLILAAALFATTLVLTRLGVTLPAGWVVVVLLYGLAPLGAYFRQIDTAGLVLTSATMVLVPFVIAAVVVRPTVLRRWPLLTPLGLLLAVAVISLSWTPAPSLGVDKVILWIFTGILPAVFVFILASVGAKVGWMPVVIAATATAAATLLFADRTYPLTLFDANPIWVSRGVFLGALVLLFLPYPLVAKIVAVPILVAAGLYTTSLGPLIGFGAGLLAGFVEVLRHSTSPRVRFGWLAVAFSVGAVAIALVSGASDTLLALVYEDPNTEARARYLGIAWEGFIESPIFGIGIGGFSSLGAHDYPHNLFAEVAVELGFVGLAVLMAWVVMALRAAAGSPLMIGLVVATSTFALFSGSLASNSELWLITTLSVATSPLLTDPADA